MLLFPPSAIRTAFRIPENVCWAKKEAAPAPTSTFTVNHYDPNTGSESSCSISSPILETTHPKGFQTSKLTPIRLHEFVAPRPPLRMSYTDYVTHVTDKLLSLPLNSPKNTDSKLSRVYCTKSLRRHLLPSDWEEVEDSIIDDEMYGLDCVSNNGRVYDGRLRARDRGLKGGMAIMTGRRADLYRPWKPRFRLPVKEVWGEVQDRADEMEGTKEDTVNFLAHERQPSRPNLFIKAMDLAATAARAERGSERLPLTFRQDDEPHPFDQEFADEFEKREAGIFSAAQGTLAYAEVMFASAPMYDFYELVEEDGDERADSVDSLASSGWDEEEMAKNEALEF